MTSKFDIIDSHLHVYDLKVRANFPKQNPRSLGTYEFPNEEPLIRDMPQEYAKEIANKAGVKKVVFMMCYDDCPEESQWVYDKVVMKSGSGWVQVEFGLQSSGSHLPEI